MAFVVEYWVTKLLGIFDEHSYDASISKKRVQGSAADLPSANFSLGNTSCLSLGLQSITTCYTFCSLLNICLHFHSIKYYSLGYNPKVTSCGRPMQVPVGDGWL